MKNDSHLQVINCPDTGRKCIILGIANRGVWAIIESEKPRCNGERKPFIIPI